MLKSNLLSSNQTQNRYLNLVIRPERRRSNRRSSSAIVAQEHMKPIGIQNHITGKEAKIPGLEIGQIGVGNDSDPNPNRRVVGKGRSEQGPRSVNAMPWYRTGTNLSGLIPNRSVGRDR